MRIQEHGIRRRPIGRNMSAAGHLCEIACREGHHWEWDRTTGCWLKVTLNENGVNKVNENSVVPTSESVVASTPPDEVAGLTLDLAAMSARYLRAELNSLALEARVHELEAALEAKQR